MVLCVPEVPRSTHASTTLHIHPIPTPGMDSWAPPTPTTTDKPDPQVLPAHSPGPGQQCVKTVLFP